MRQSCKIVFGPEVDAFIGRMSSCFDAKKRKEKTFFF